METTEETASWNLGWTAGVASADSLAFREPDLPHGNDEQHQTAFREGYIEGRAWKLGRDHGATGVGPFRDLDRGGEALLMDALGEVGPTTKDNQPLRLRLLSVYTDAYEAAEGMYIDP